jgi:catechol 2,3-dioxygenase-like lactoylglutathione lyase family enzyme
MHHVVLDCPDPDLLAGFYSALLGTPISYRSADWVVVAADSTSSGLAFQRAPDHQPPAWPDPHRPQQFHLDLMVEDPDAARDWVIGLGARPLAPPEADLSVYADPAGHPFCLIRRPAWAPPLADD